MTATVRGTEISIGVRLIAEECCNCGVVFAMSAELRQRRLDDHRSFYCPNGHGQSYTGKSEAERLREQLRAVEQRAQWDRESRDDAIERRDRAERSLAATRGVVTKLRRRAVAGTCPFGCRRHFADVERHVASRHPGERLEGES